MLIEILIVLLLTALHAYFAMAEFAVLSARRSRLKQMADDGHRGARKALALAEDPSRFLSTVQTGITLVAVLAGVFSGATIAQHLGASLNANIGWIDPHGHAVAVTLLVIVVGWLTLFIGELLPKRIAIARAEAIAVRVSGSVQLLEWIVYPFVRFLHISTDWSLRLMGIEETKGAAVTEEEVKTMIAEGTQEGVFEAAEKKMLEGVMRLTDRTVRSIMTPRIDMVWIGCDDPPEDIRETIRTSGYSRFPVARGDLEEVVGVIHAKDLLNAMLAGRPLDVQALKRPILSMPETTTVLNLLEQFKATGQHQSIVIDEYGTVEGLVTVADILIAIAGELPEHGQEALDKPVRRADGSWLIDAMTPIDEIASLTGIRRIGAEGDYHTLAGFVLAQLGRIPTTGDTLTWQGIGFEVIDMDGRRIDKIMIVPALDEAGANGGA